MPAPANTPAEAQLQADNACLRAALVGLVGSDAIDELRQMASVLRNLPDATDSRAVTLDAIHALLNTHR